MGKVVRALVEPDILVWARESAGYSAEAAAKKVPVSLNRLLAWEDEETEDRPTVNQLRKLASIYKRPLSAFYLSKRPPPSWKMHDYRRLPGAVSHEFSPELIYEQRQVDERREQMLNMFSDLQIDIMKFEHTAKIDENPEDVGDRVRDVLGLTMEEQESWIDDRTAFNEWRGKIEKLGVLVFQMSSVRNEEVSGFAVSSEVLPAISINRRSTPFTRRIFSLIHEFAHLLLRCSGVSDYNVVDDRTPGHQDVEVWCNAVAAATIMPRKQFLSNEAIRGKSENELSDEVIKKVSDRFKVSREAVVRRLLVFNIVSRSFYLSKRKEYSRQRADSRKVARDENAGKEFRKNPAQDAMSELGKPYIRLVFQSFHNRRMTLSDAVGYLNIKVKHLEKLERHVRS